VLVLPAVDALSLTRCRLTAAISGKLPTHWLRKQTIHLSLQGFYLDKDEVEASEEGSSLRSVSVSELMIIGSHGGAGCIRYRPTIR
jgi:hypothetical protein